MVGFMGHRPRRYVRVNERSEGEYLMLLGGMLSPLGGLHTIWGIAATLVSQMPTQNPEKKNTKKKHVSTNFLEKLARAFP